MVIAYAGRRAQSLHGDPEAVAARIRCLLTELRPSAVVGALADGADLLLAEAALGVADGPRLEVILPTPEEVFRVESVAPSWRGRFDRVLERVPQRGSIQSLGLENGREAYLRANEAFLDRATDLASNGERAIVLVIAGEGEGEIVENLVASAALRGVPSLRIDPHHDQQASCDLHRDAPGRKPDREVGD